MKASILTLGASLALLGAPSAALAFGTRPVVPTPVPITPAEPTSQQAKPFRALELARVTVPAFYFPNGTRADFNVDLNALIEGQVNSSRYLRTTLADPLNPSRLLLSGGITSFEADVVGMNLKIGWNKAGVLLPGQGVSGEVTLRLTAMTMDFMVYDRVTKQVYLSSNTNETLSQLKLDVKVNLADVNATLEAFYKTVMSKAVQKATADIMAKLENKANFDTLFWEASVLGVDQADNFLALGAGAAAGLKEGDVLTVYSYCAPEEEAAGQCFRRFLADVRVKRALMNSAEATPWTASDSLGSVRAGDRVEVKALSVGVAR